MQTAEHPHRNSVGVTPHTSPGTSSNGARYGCKESLWEQQERPFFCWLKSVACYLPGRIMGLHCSESASKPGVKWTKGVVEAENIHRSKSSARTMLEEPTFPFLLLSEDKLMLHSPDCPWSHRSPPGSVSCVWRLHICVPMTVLPTFYCFLETGFYSVFSLSQAGLALSMYPRLAIFFCLNFLGAGIVGVWYHIQLLSSLCQ